MPVAFYLQVVDGDKPLATEMFELDSNGSVALVL